MHRPRPLHRPPPTWPDPPAPQACHGVFGDLIRVIDRASEADPVALFGQGLVYFGSMIGRSAHFTVEAGRQYGNEFLTLVGQSSKARKGTSRGQIRQAFTGTDEACQLVQGLLRGVGTSCSFRNLLCLSG